MNTRILFRIFLGFALSSVLGFATGLPLAPAELAAPLTALGFVAGIRAVGFLIMWAAATKSA
jgi:hypothetical protein